MKKFAILILVLCLVCGVLSGCSSDRGNIDDTDGKVTDSPRDDEGIMDDDDIIDDDILDDDKGGNNGDNGSRGNDDNSNIGNSGTGTGNSSGNDKNSSKSAGAVPTSIPGESGAVATQPVTP